MGTNQVEDDARFAAQLHQQEVQQVQMGRLVGGGGAAPQVVQGMVVPGGATGNIAPVAQAVPMGQPMPMAQPMAVGQPIGQPMTYGVGEHGMPYAVAQPLAPNELTVLNYRFAMLCFAGIDTISTLLNAVAAVLALTKGEDDAEDDDDNSRRSILGHSGIDEEYTTYIALLGLLFLVGPICGFLGARHLRVNLVTVYLVFCFAKMSYEMVLAILTPYLWFIIIVLIQMWITKIVAAFWQALRRLSAERCKELLDPEVMMGSRAHMVYW